MVLSRVQGNQNITEFMFVLCKLSVNFVNHPVCITTGDCKPPCVYHYTDGASIQDDCKHCEIFCVQMVLADRPTGSSLPVINVPYSSTACSLMSLLSAILSTLAVSDAEKRHSSSSVTAIANADSVTSQTSDIIRSSV